MDLRTGFVDVNSGKDLVELYEPNTFGPIGTTHYLSQIHGKDLGSIFIMNANLGGLGLTGTVGANCGHKLLNGTDLGSMFCVKGSIYSGPVFNSLYFDGPVANQGGVLNSSSYYGPSELPNGGTVEIWIKVANNNTSSPANDYQGLITKEGLWGILLKDNKIAVFNWASPQGYTGSGPLLNDNKWHHIATTFNPGVSGGSNVYIDGQSILTYTMSYSNEIIFPLTIGSNNSKQYTKTSVSFVRIWNTRKTASFIASNYNRYLNPASYPDMIGFYPFSESSGTTIANSSSNNSYSFTLQNAPTWSSVVIPSILMETLVRVSGLISSIPTGCVGLFACKWVNNGYSGPIFKIRRSSDSVKVDFYMDKTGSQIGMATNGTGTSLTTWLSGATACVDTWYDQSGAGRHATQTNTTLQPTFDATNGVNFYTADANNSIYLNIPQNMLGTATNPSYTISFLLQNSSLISSTTTPDTVFLYGDHITSNKEIEVYIKKPISGTNGYLMHAFAGNGDCQYAVSYTSNNQLDKVMSFTYTPSTRSIFFDKSASANATSSTQTLNYAYTGGTQVNTLGIPFNIINQYNGKFNGSLKYFSVLNTADATNKNIMESIY